MIPYEALVSSVHDRADLLDRTLRSMATNLDAPPARIVVHEDVRKGQPYVAGRTDEILQSLEQAIGVPVLLLESNPGIGLGRSILRLLETATTDLVFYTQEDFDFLRVIPIARALEIASANPINLVRFNKQKTEWCKGEDRPPAEQWHAQEIEMGGQTFVINDRWCHQPSLWRRSVALEGYRAICGAVPAGNMVDRCEDKFDSWMNRTLGKGCACVDGHQEARRNLCRTFIWGKIREPAFVKHTGSERRSQGWS